MMVQPAASPNRRRLTDADIERLARKEESGEAYTGEHLGPAMQGTPPLLGPNARALIQVFGLERVVKLEKLAKAQGVQIEDLLRKAVDSLRD